MFYLLFCSCNICFIPLFYVYVYFVATLGGVSSVDPSRAAWSGRQCLRLEADEGRLWPCDPPSPQPHCRLPGAASFFCERKRKRNINMKGIFKCVPRGLDLFLCDASIHLYSLFLCNFEIMCYIIYCYYVIVLGFRVLYNFIFDFIFWYFDSLSHYFLICLVPSALPKINTSEIQEKYEPLCVTYIMYPVTINLTDIPLFFIQFRYMIIVKFMMVSCNKNPRNRTHMSPVATAFHCPFGGVELSSYLPWSDLLLVANSWQSSSSTTSFVGTWTSSWCRSGRRSGWTPWKSRHLFISPSKF